MDYQNVIECFRDICKKILGDTLTGIYLHGSMAMHCFNPEKSDIDLLVVIDGDISDGQKTSLMSRIVELNALAPAKGLEISFVKRTYCKPFVYPTPFELHFSPMHLQWFKTDPKNYVENMKGEDTDLAAHVTIINRYGIVICGEEIESVFGAVLKKDYLESIWSDVEHAKEEILHDPMYMILNLCRVLAFIQDDVCLSKQQGGVWGITNMPERYHALIKQALDSYQTNQEIQADTEQLVSFAEELLNMIIEKKERIR